MFAPLNDWPALLNNWLGPLSDWFAPLSDWFAPLIDWFAPLINWFAPLKLKTDFEPQIARIDTDFEEVALSRFFTVW